MFVTPRHYIHSFLEYLQFQKRYSQHTLLAYETDLVAFFNYMAKQYPEVAGLSEIRPGYIRSWLVTLKGEEKMTSKTINRKISTLKSYFKFQVREGLLEASPMGTIPAPKISKRLPQYVEQEQADTLFRHVVFPEGWEGRTHRLILELLYYTGIRRAELIGLKVRQVDAGNMSIKVLGKGNKERVIPVQAAFMQELGEYCRDRAAIADVQEDRLLVRENGKALSPGYVLTVVRKYLSLVTTIDKKSPHVLRHSFATHLVNNGADINAIKELLGHSSLAATQVYTHNSIEKLKEAYRLAHPKA
jgi:integrase/recombinase XerC